MEAVPLMTLDYAQHLGSYLPNHVEVEEMLHPRRLLDSVESGFPLFDIHGASVDSIGPVYDKNERDMLALLRIRVAFGLVHSEKRRLGTFIPVPICRIPKEKPIYLDFDETWDYESTRIDRYQSQQTQQQQPRFFEQEYQAPRIALYEVVGNPISIDAGPCPGFYTIGKDISVDSLESLRDLDTQRHFCGETPSQQAFLRRCLHLKSLEMFVHCPDMFAWAVERLTDGTVVSAEHLLRNLHDVQLRANLSVLNNVMTAFGDTLRHVKVQEPRWPPEKQLDDVASDVRLSRHSRVGDWNLPFIRTINIECRRYSGAYLGDFSSCPKLEKLKIKLIGDPTIGQAYIAPVWRLPHLKTLELTRTAALLFNYDSLDHLPSLESLVMIARSSGGNLRLMIPRLCSYYPPKISGDVIASTSTLIGQRWKDRWDLPRLKVIVLHGPPSTDGAVIGEQTGNHHTGRLMGHVRGGPGQSADFYAPNLERLRLPLDSRPVESDNWTWLGDQFVRATVNSRSLRHLESRVKISEEVKSELGLERIAPWEVKECKEADKKILLVQEQNYVSKHEGGVLCK
ncbi:hypothetical protein BGZ74_006634 [Mortierella antarctica]|nr:hypothetical protein BGZ74_006634 [Mortierella antarctica]